MTGNKKNLKRECSAIFFKMMAWIVFDLTSFDAQAQLKQTPPNIIFLVCDQMRGDAIDVVGNSNVRTPSVDKMDGGHIERENFYGKPEYNRILQSLKKEIGKQWAWQKYNE